MKLDEASFDINPLPAQANAVPAMDDFAIDPDRSSIDFRVKHLGITFVYGRFRHVVGRYLAPSGGSGEADIDIGVRAADIDTGNAVRDGHLRSPDFFDAEKYPWIRFRSVSIESLDGHYFRILGDLSLHGVTRRITVEASHTSSGADGRGLTRTGFQTKFTILRSDYGMKKMLGGVGDRVELTVRIEGVRQK